MNFFVCCKGSAGNMHVIDLDEEGPSTTTSGVSELEEFVLRRPTLLTSKRGGGMAEGVSAPESKQQITAVDTLADLTSSFSRSRRCKHLCESTAARAEAEYFVDEDLGHLVVRVKTTGGAGRQPDTIVCPLGSIEDIYTVDDGEDCFPSHIIESLTPQEKEGLFLIVCTPPSHDVEPSGIYLLEASKSARDGLLKHLQEQEGPTC
mmetsp:Transcript_146639/g.372139  ORF Transcript_146639/g.372139 Transcript_146639/m.372139 type:complete len:205 (+) Transcript_146639:95-709(+)